MNYKDINDKWKSFLLENTFKEDKLVDPEKAKKKKKHRPEKKRKEGEKEIITNEWEEFEEQQEGMDEWSLPTYVGSEAPQSAGYNDADSVEEEQLEEMSSMSAGDVAGHAGGAGGSFMSKKAFKRKWS